MSIHKDVSIQCTQDRILSIFKCFDAFCKENEIPYFSLGGTLLGAVRHQGFIPWDDDIDVGVPREHYDRLLALASGVPSPFRIEAQEFSSNYIYPYAKMYDTNSLVTEDYITPFTRGFWIDVFPIDGTYDNAALRKVHFKAIKIVNAASFIKSRRYNRMDSPGIKRVAKEVIALLLSAIPQRFLRTSLDWLLRRRSPLESRAVGNLLGRWGTREIVPATLFTTAALVDFCGMKIRAPASPSDYLSSIYGDYMKLPPEHQRVSGHRLTRVDFNESYIGE